MDNCTLKTILAVLFFGGLLALPFVVLYYSDNTPVEGVIIDKKYEESYMLPTTVGKMTTYIRHPEQYYVVVIDKDSKQRRAQVSEAAYDTLQVGSYYIEK